MSNQNEKMWFDFVSAITNLIFATYSSSPPPSSELLPGALSVYLTVCLSLCPCVSLCLSLSACLSVPPYLYRRIFFVLRISHFFFFSFPIWHLAVALKTGNSETGSSFTSSARGHFGAQPRNFARNKRQTILPYFFYCWVTECNSSQHIHHDVWRKRKIKFEVIK